MYTGMWSCVCCTALVLGHVSSHHVIDAKAACLVEAVSSCQDSTAVNHLITRAPPGESRDRDHRSLTTVTCAACDTLPRIQSDAHLVLPMMYQPFLFQCRTSCQQTTVGHLS